MTSLSAHGRCEGGGLVFVVMLLLAVPSALMAGPLLLELLERRIGDSR